ncbi:MAG: DUF262 domain-containing protein [Gammaproteobacteria bacterium]|nr:DUF262 domain-containing protein [Gammaproteobacteria bacterium]MBU1732476.1 DUF262 domain-containing protein [Gammaproteobacteria bacterium]MBU1891759.1 DUF262 domain-containing protein [Gammaproteobacteria bacterium]
MSLEEEIGIARKEIVSDGYDMSIGELINLYKEKEIRIDPEFQRLFRWNLTRKTRFVESILLGLPLPPIFVYQSKSGVWELIDGLQRVSTILEFVGILQDPNGVDMPATELEGTRFLPSLANKKWAPSSEEADDGIGTTQQLQIKRARMRVEILKQESDPQAKYELFQRLNTGGETLSEQEVRNCVGIMLDRDFQTWLVKCADLPVFKSAICQTDTAIEKQAHIELALRFFAFRHIPYTQGLDVHEYLDDALVRLIKLETFDRGAEFTVFERTFGLLFSALGDSAFKRWNGQEFGGKFLQSVFEVVALGTSIHIDDIDTLGDAKEQWLVDRCKALWLDLTFAQYSGAGVRGTTRLTKLLPLASNFFKP